MEILIIALASFYLWTALRFLLPFAIPDRLALLLYGLSTYALAAYQLPHGVLEGMASAGGLILVTVLAKIDTPKYWDWRASLEMFRPRLPARRKPRMHPQDKPGPGRRLPKL
jgi:hypothetical protein